MAVEFAASASPITGADALDSPAHEPLAGQDRRADRSVVPVHTDALPGAAELFEMSLDCMCVAGFDGYWKRLNPSWSRTLGWTTEEMMAVPLIEFVHPEDREKLLAARGRLFDGEPLRTLKNRYRCKDGSYRWLEWRSVANTERQLVYAVARDVTADIEAERAMRELAESREQLQRQLVFADRMASVGTLAAGVAHEINNPLTYVLSNLETLAEGLQAACAEAATGREAEWLEAAIEARHGADRIRRIVGGVMTFGRIEAERRAIIELEPALELAVEMTLNEIRHRAELVRDYCPLPLVHADDARLGQVFTNLLVNAAQAIPEGNAGGHEIRVVTKTEAGRAVIEVLDTGPGIPEAIMGRIFDPFFTTKPVGVGTGLGLSICHTIVTSMGGEITASNREGGGARFRVVLPPARPSLSEAPREAPPAREEVPAPRASVLVVDDELNVARAFARMLRDHDVTVVTNARDAIERACEGRFDVILSDLMMPGMSGMELHEELRRRNDAAAERVVFVTGGAFTPSARDFLERVPNARIDKPVDAATLRALVARFMR